MANAAVPENAHRALGLTDEEYARIVEILERAPSAVELAMYAVMWSEHCSYKSSRVHLGRLPSQGEAVLVGPGENAGVVDVGDGLAIAIRIESHNHPSAIEPYQGAATGVGGILRDVFTMGARPIALMDGLFVGPLEQSRSRFLLDGIVRGVAGYGNSVGVPTVGGQIVIDPTYAGNPLVNVFCLGLLRREDLVLSAASGVGNLVVLLGARTGRDGIGGVSVLASSELDAGTELRPSVQVADPYEEKRLIEACLELLQAHLVVGIQDLGGAGLACATSETAAKGGLSMTVDLSAVPRREPRMSGVEVMTSESQERMLAIVRPDDLDKVQEVCRRWEIEAAVVGTVTPRDPDDVGRLRVVTAAGGDLLAEFPAASLTDDAPRYRRPIAPPENLAERRAAGVRSEDLAGLDAGAALRRLLIDPSWIYRQYDHQLFLNTVRGPGEADAAVLRLAAPGVGETRRGLALSLDANAGWCALDPRNGTAATVAESALNIACTGARPLALVNCLNFGNPEHPEVMWELTEAIEGMSLACEALDLPVVGGNVSLYNASEGADIDPTPVVTAVGLIERLDAPPPAIGWREGDALVLVGPPPGSLDGSRLARDVLGRRGGTLTTVDLEAHARLCALVRSLVAGDAGPTGLVRGVHDCSDGGLALSLAESALRAGVGAGVSVGGLTELFAELPPRAVVATGRPDEVLAAAARAGVDARLLGTASGTRLVARDEAGDTVLDCALAELDASFRGRLHALDTTAAH